MPASTVALSVLCHRGLRCQPPQLPFRHHQARLSDVLSFSSELELWVRAWWRLVSIKQHASAMLPSTSSRATACRSQRPMRNRAWRWPAQRKRRHTMHGTPIRSCSVLAAAALSFSAWKLVGAGARKPRPSSDFSRKPAQPAHLSPCAALLKPLGCTVGVASSPLPCSEPSPLRCSSFLLPQSSVLLVTQPFLHELLADARWLQAPANSRLPARPA